MIKQLSAGSFWRSSSHLPRGTASVGTGSDIERIEQQRGQAILSADMLALYSIYDDESFYNRTGGDSLGAVSLAVRCYGFPLLRPDKQ